MLNLMEASVVMFIRILQMSKIMLILISFLLILQLIIYQISNKRINLYKKIKRSIKSLENASKN